MPMSAGQLESLAVVAKRHREWEASHKERGDPAGLGIGAAALLIELAGEEIAALREALHTVNCYLVLQERGESVDAQACSRMREVIRPLLGYPIA